MNTGNRTLTLLVGGVLALVLAGAAGYFLFYEPIADMHAQADALRSDLSDMDSSLLKAVKDKKRLAVALKRSLPDHPFAAQEYEAALTKVLRDARLPTGSYDVKFRSADGRPVPELAKGKPAYSRLVVELTLRKVTYAQTLAVLDGYYRLNLLQQITKFDAKRADDNSARPASSTSSDRPDLTVTFTTEAITLDGAEKRATLLPHPVGAAVGGVAYALPEPARGLKPIELAPVLATPARDYSLLLYKDIFHGPPPPAPKVEPKKETVVAKEDTSPFIRLTALGRSSDGSGMAVIEDLAAPGKMEYTVSLRRTSDGLSATVSKEYFLKGKRKKYDADSPVLDISEASSGTDRKFRVVGVDGDSLILAERKSAAEPAPAPQTGGFRGKGGPPRAAAAPPQAAVVGAALAAVPSERVYEWRQGEPLSKLRELSKADAAKAVQRATGLASVPPSSPPAAFAAPVPGGVETAGK